MPSEQIDPMLFEKSYYLEPEKTGAKPYALLREALEAADRMALVTVSLRNRMSLAVLRVRDDVIVMQTMMWPDEIRKADFGSVDTSEAKPAEVKMATMLVETLAGDFDADEYEDDYREAVEALVKAKIEGGEVKRTPETKKSSGEVVDLLAALQRSVDAAKTARGEKPAADADDDADADATKPAKKSAAKKTAGEEDRRQEGGHEEDRGEEAGEEGQLTPGLPRRLSATRNPGLHAVEVVYATRGVRRPAAPRCLLGRNPRDPLTPALSHPSSAPSRSARSPLAPAHRRHRRLAVRRQRDHPLGRRQRPRAPAT